MSGRGDGAFERRGESLEERGEQGVLRRAAWAPCCLGWASGKRQYRGLLRVVAPCVSNPVSGRGTHSLLSLELNAKLNSVSVQMPGLTQTLPETVGVGPL